MKNTFVKVLSMMMALMMVVGILTVVPATAAECDHVKASEEPVKTVDPTCAKPGYKSYLCFKCGEQFIPDDEVIMPSAEFHKIETVDPVQASCLTNAFTGGKRCVNEGCPNVKETYVGVQEQPGTQKAHSFVREVVGATCTVAGVTQYRCTMCNYTAEQLSGIEALGGIDFNKDNQINALDSKFLAGVQNYNDWAKIDGEAAKDPDHSDLVWTVVTDPVKGNATTRCTEGLAQGVCKYCKVFVKTAVIPVHDFSSQINPSNSTCSDYKNTAMQCKYCFLPDPANNADDMWAANQKTDHCVGEGAIAKKFEGALAANATYYRADGKTVIKYEEFLKAGLAVGTPFYVAPSCFNTGKQLIECKCGELVYVELPALGHSFANTQTDAHWNAIDHIYWAVDCATPSYKRQDCTRCDAFITKNVQEAYKPNGHTLETVVVAPTCDAMGYTYEKCISGKFTRLDGVVVECKHQTAAHDYTQKLEHNFGATTLKKNAKCGQADGYQHVCQQPNINNKDAGYICGYTETAAVPQGAAHSYSNWQLEAGTCVTASKQFKVCSTCNDKVYNNDFVGTTDAANHEYVHYGWEGDGSAPTCTAAKVELLYCNKCAADDLSTVKKGDTKYADHTIAENIYAVVVNGKVNVYGKDGTDTAKTIYKGAKATKDVTCQADGYKNDGKYCVVCGYAAKAATKLTKESVFNTIEEHVGYTEDMKPVRTTKATCSAAPTETYLTSCCGLITITVGEKLKDHSYTKEVDADAPDCVNPGNHYHVVCEFCGAHKAGSTTTEGCTNNCDNHYAIDQDLTDTYVIPATGHTMKTEGAKLNIDGADGEHPGLGCYNSSTAAYTYCEDCDLRVFNNKEYIYNSDNPKDVAAFDKAIVVPAHGTKYMETFAAVEPTCTSKGVDGSKAYCTVCQPNAWILPVKSHRTFDFYANDPTSASYNCTESSVKVTKCMDCAYNVSTNYMAAKDTHEYNTYGADGKAEWNPIGLKPNTSHCTAPTYKEKTCKYCGVDCPEYRVVVVDEAAVGHYVMEEGVRIDISWNCTDIANFIGKKCAECKVTVTTDNINDLIQHTIVPKDKAPTCTEDGYHITYCSACNTTDSNVYKYEKLDKLSTNGQHTIGTILEEVPVSGTIDGYVKYVCAVCHVTTTNIIPAPTVNVDDLSIQLNVANQIALAGKNFTDSSIVAVTVALDAANANVWGIKFNLYYGEELEFIPELTAWAENNEFIVNKTVNDNNVDEVKDKNGKVVVAEAEDYVSVTASAPNGEDKMPTNVTITEETALVTLYFRVVNATDSESGKDSKVWINNVDKKDLEVIDNEGEQKSVGAAEAKIEVAKLMDYNADGGVTMVDVLAASKILSGVLTDKNGAAITYDVTLDVDKDGEITAADLLAVLAYINGEKDFAEIAQ